MAKSKKDNNTEQQILNAARQVFLEKGLSGARMQDIADKAEINKAMLHYYFKNKELLFETIFQETAGKLFPHFDKLMDSDLNFFDKIRSIVSSYIEMVSQNPYLPLFVISELNKNPEIGLKHFFEKQRPGFVKKFKESIEESINSGLILPINPIHLIINMFSMCAFPFMAKPMLKIITGIEEEQFNILMEQRKVLVAEFIINSIKK
ncbi:MAG: TetR family transcriptional regulator [Chitinophagaceae bacterium BSSC1]|jgi:TetR/AcrR family transcriptional regulator|nr:MAG: TetR family transcriptional regulator [Chitinophagaceae bacterium BSSC1]